MADIQIDEIINRPAIEGEVSFLAAKIKEVEALIANAKTSGIQIMNAQNFKEFNTAVKSAEVTQAQLTKATKEAERASIASAKAKQAEANAAKALAQQQLAEIKLREANAKAAEREAAAKVRSAKPSQQEYIDSVPFEIKTNTDAIRETGEAVSDLEREQANAANSATAWGGAQQQASQSVAQAAPAVTAYADDLERLTGTLNENEQLQAVYRQELQEVSRELRSLEKNTSANEKSTAAYQQKVAALLSRQNALKKESSELTQTIKNQVKEQNSAAGSLDQLRARLNLATQAYEKLSDTQKKGALGLQLQKEITVVTAEVSKQEQAIGRFQRNVGNYKNSIVKGFQSAFSGLRTLANILPGVGISGILLIAFNGISALIKNIRGASKAFNEAKVAAKAYGEAISDANKKAAETSTADVTKLELYRTILNDVTKSQEQRTQALNAYNQIADKANQLDVSQLNNLDLINTKIQTQINLIEKRAFSRAAEAVLALKAQKIFDAEEAARIKAEEDIQNESINNISVVTRNGAEAEKYVQQINRQNSLNRRIASDQTVKQAKVEFEAAKKALYARITIEGFAAEEVTKKDKKAKEDQKKSALDLFKFNMGLLIEEQKQIIATSTGDRRIIARRELAKLEQQLISGVATFELAQKNITTDEILLIERKREVELRQSRADTLNDILAYAIAERNLLLSEADKTSEELAAKAKSDAEQAIKDQQTLTQGRIDSLESQLESQLRSVSDNQRKQRLAVLEQYEAGKIDKKRYDQEILRIENESLAKSLQLQIDYYTQLAFLSNLDKDQQTKFLEDIEKLRKQLADLGIKTREENADKEIDIEKKKNEALRSLATEISGLTFDIFIAGIERQKNAVQDLIDELEKQKQKEIEVANQTIANAADRANAISVIEARAAAQREQLERRQRELEQRRARFERASSIANIIANTAQGVTAALASVPPNPILAALVAAIGAAQVARVLATPIPKYKDGTDNHPGGYAILGDGGKREPFVTPDGETGMSGDTPGLYDLPRGTKVYSDINEYAKHVHTRVPTFGDSSRTDLTPVVMAVNGMGRRMELAIKKMPQTVVKSEGAWSRYVRNGNSTQNWLNKNL